MKKEKDGTKWPLFRMIVPAFAEFNIFSRIALETTALGPIMVATAADKLWRWRVEVIDENNYRKGPRGKDGLPDHEALQNENPAKVVGFFCGLSSTMERVWQLAEFYRRQGAFIVTGSWHAHYQPEETLRAGIDIVAHGDGENTIRQLLKAIEKEESFSEVPGISFLENGRMKTNPPERVEISDLDDLPFPSFNLLRFAKLKTYPIGRIRGCSKSCEFCSVRGKPNWASGEHLFETVEWLVETQKAREFFLVDDRLEEDRRGTLDFFNSISKKYGRALKFTVQIRLEAAKDEELLAAMKKAGVKVVCIGYESCLDEELLSMRKGYRSAEMITWTEVLRKKFGFFVHGMFIFGYPPSKEEAVSIGAEERMKRLKKFIRDCRLDTIQILRPVPLVGTKLRSRLEKEGKLFPLEMVPWSYYDGSYLCFHPNNMTLRQLQEFPTEIMRWFYSPVSFIRIPYKAVMYFFSRLVGGWNYWYRGLRNDIARFGGYRLFKKWRKRDKDQAFLEKLKNFR